MKKTLIALFAFAGMASGATLVTFDIDRSGDAVTFTETSEVISLTYDSWSYTGGGNKTTGWQTPSNSVYSDCFTPDAQLRSGSTDMWSMVFTVTNSGTEDITLDSFVFNCFGINGGGSDKNAAIPVTLTLGDATTSDFELDFGGRTSEATLEFGTPITVGAGKSTELTLTMSNAKSYNTYTGITSGSVSYSVVSVPEPATASLSLLGLAALMIRRRR